MMEKGRHGKMQFGLKDATKRKRERMLSSFDSVKSLGLKRGAGEKQKMKPVRERN